MSSPAAELASYKLLGAFGVTAFAAIPPIMAMIEPATWKDIEARMVYMTISAISAGVVLLYYRPKDNREAVGRMMAAVVFALAFVEPIAVRIRPYVAQTAALDAAPLAAAFPAAVLCGICGWWTIGLAAWLTKNPLRVFKLWGVIRGTEKFQSVLTDESGETFSTSTKGGSQGQPGIAETRTPEQTPAKQEQSGGKADADASKKTT